MLRFIHKAKRGLGILFLFSLPKWLEIPLSILGFVTLVALIISGI